MYSRNQLQRLFVMTFILLNLPFKEIPEFPKKTLKFHKNGSFERVKLGNNK